MTGTLRLAWLAPIALVGGVLSGCGGGGGRTAASGPAAAKAQIKTDWTTFFNASTPASRRVRLLQDGQRYQPVIVAQSKSPLAQQSSASVSSITLTGPSSASVRYTILLAGKPALKNQTGTAVRAGGVWKVSDRSFCALLSLQGKPPPACASG